MLGCRGRQGLVPRERRQMCTSGPLVCELQVRCSNLNRIAVTARVLCGASIVTLLVMWAISHFTLIQVPPGTGRYWRDPAPGLTLVQGTGCLRIHYDTTRTVSLPEYERVWVTNRLACWFFKVSRSVRYDEEKAKFSPSGRFVTCNTSVNVLVRWHTGLLALMLGAAWGVMGGIAWVVRWRRYKAGHCVCCGYCLRGLSVPRCPECGTPFVESSERL